MNDYEILAQRLHEARVAAGRTQSDAAKLLGCTAQAVSNWERGYTRIDCVSLFRLLLDFGTDINSFLRDCGFAVTLPAAEGDATDEERLLRAYRALDAREGAKLARIAEVLADTPEAAEKPTCRVIPLYHYLAAAGYPSPAPGADYDDYEVDADTQADFAVRVAGDSMEPWIRDGEVILCQRRVDLRDGEVGIFYARDGMVCKQFCQDSVGNIYLFSLNRARRDADVTIAPDSDLPLFCYGRVLLSRRIPLPAD